jgi:hypothetical protein
MGENRTKGSKKKLTIFTREMTTTFSDGDNVGSPRLILINILKLVYMMYRKLYIIRKNVCKSGAAHSRS